VLVVLAVLATGCGEGSEDGAPEVDTVAVAAGTSGYEEIVVRDGGRVTGRVTLMGEPPELEPFAIEPAESLCAPASANNRLRVGGSGGVASAVVYIEKIVRGKPMPAIPAPERTVDQRNCQYTPHLVAVPVGAAVYFTNGDDLPHNVRVEDRSSGKMLMNRAQPVQGRVDTLVVDRSGPISVGCDYHPWMNAYVFGVENPYYAVTDTSGTFVLENVPAGNYTVKMWLNGFETTVRRDNQGRIIRYSFGEPHMLEQQVVVAPGEAAGIAFEVPAG